MDFVEIAKSWINSMNPTPEMEDIANSRIEICNSCEEKKHTGTEILSFYYCGKCGCPLQKKIYSPNGIEACPLKKWVK